MSKRKFVLMIVHYGFGLLVAICTLAPFLWMFLTSIAYQKDLTSVPLKFPTLFTFSRYIGVLINTSTSDMSYVFRISMYNSFIIAFFVTLISLIVGSVAAYSYSRLKFRFRKSMIMLTLFTYMIPPVALVIPMYMILSDLGLLDRKSTLIVLYLSFIIPFIIWVMQGYFGAISKSYEEAAYIDGCNRFQVLWNIFLPIARPGLIATAILAFLMSWDEFFFALTFTSSLAAKTIPVAIAEFNGKFSIDYGMICTGGIIASLPPVLIALIFQKYIVMGMTGGGVKE